MCVHRQRFAQEPDDAGGRLVCPLTGRVHARVFARDGAGGGDEGGLGGDAAIGAVCGAAAQVDDTAAADQDAPSGLGAVHSILYSCSGAQQPHGCFMLVGMSLS
jgi:hypothetical protein